MPFIPRLLFLHIPRTGGTSFRYYLTDNFGKENIAPVPVPEEISESYYDSVSVSTLHAFHDNIVKYDYPIIMGHYDWGVTYTYPKHTPVVILRDPVNRVISSYSHYLHNISSNSWARLIPPRLSLRELAAHPFGRLRVENCQTGILSGCRWTEGRVPKPVDLVSAKNNLHHCIVGIFEEYPKFIQSFSSMFGIKDEIYYSNHFPYASIDDVDFIREQNRFDQELYEYAINLT